MVRCPVCQHADQAQKASAVVADGSYTTHTTGHSSGTGWLSGGGSVRLGMFHRFQNFSQSGLAAQLSYRPPWLIPWWCAGLGVLLCGLGVVGGFAAELGAYFFLLLGGLGLFSALAATRGMGVRGFLIRTAVLVPLVLLLVVGSGFVRMLTHELVCLAGGALVIAVTAAQRLLHWLRRREHARTLDAWNQLYYCFRDDVVFHPVTGRYGPPAAAQTIAQGG